MIHGANPIDRLLPRHDTETGLELTWNVRMARKGLFTKEEEFSHATIQDLSLEGALVEVPDSQVHELGTTIAVRFQGTKGRAVVCHSRKGNTGYFLYGIKFLPGREFNAAVGTAVGEMRGRPAELDLAWNQAN